MNRNNYAGKTMAINETYKDLMILYLDGEATESEQKALFDAMAQNTELQEEFAQAIAFDKVMIEDREALAPSKELTHALFVKAGFEQPLPPVGGGASAGLSTFATGLMQNMLSGLVISSMVFLGYNAAEKMSEKMEGDALKTATIARVNMQETKAPKAQENYPMVSSKEENAENAPDNSGKVSGSQKRARNFAVQTRNSGSENYETTANDAASIAQISPLQNDFESANYDEPSEFRREDAPAVTLETKPIYSSRLEIHYFSRNAKPQTNAILGFAPQIEMHKTSAPLNLSLTVNGLAGIGGEAAGTNGSEAVLYKNFSGAIRYHFNEHHSLGLAAGTEALQIYEISGNGDEYEYNEKNSVLTLGVNYRYNVGHVFANVPINPFAEITVGGSKYGPAGKLGLGFNYDISGSFSLGLGYVFTGLMYSNPDKSKVTFKSAIVYGLMYKL